jgi:hypothetical protein
MCRNAPNHKASTGGRDMEYSGNIQGTFREHSGNIQGTFREHSGHIHEAFRDVHERSQI